MSTNDSTVRNGKPDQIRSVKLEDLHVDDSYQRSIKMQLVQDIANEWRDEACGNIIVSERANGSLWVVDGQHRVAAARLIEKTHLPARVVTDHNAKEEALLRIQTNRKRNESSAERFRAMLIAEFPHAVAIVKIMRSFKSKLSLEYTQGDAVTCISAVEKMWFLDKGATLRQVLAMLYEADGRLDATNVNTRILWALQWFLEQHESYDRQRLIKVLKQSKAAMRSRSDALVAAMGGSHWVNTYRAMVELYNANVAKSARLEAVTRGYRALGVKRESD